MPHPILSPATARLRAVRFASETARLPSPVEQTALDSIGPKHLVRATKKGTPSYSPVVYAEGAKRGKRGVREVTALVLDLDHVGGEVAEEVRARLSRTGWACVAHSTYGHGADGPEDCCFRVLVLVSRPILPKEYEAVWSAANRLLGGYADPNARDVSRMWYVAACPPDRLQLAWVWFQDGRPLDVDRALASAQAGDADAPKPDEPEGDDRGRDDPIPPGERNARLTALAGAMRRHGASKETILAALREHNAARCEPPLDEDELEGIAASVTGYEPESPLTLANRTDLGNAERLVAHADGRLLYVAAWGSWMAWDGRRWVRDSDGAAVREVRVMVRKLAAQAEDAIAQGGEEEARGETLRRYAQRCESSSRINAMLSLAEKLLPASHERFDQRPYLLSCANGTLDLREGRLRPHDRADLLTRLSPVHYDPDATCPIWDAFLKRIMGGNEELMGFLQRAVGYSLTGETSEQVMFLLYGVGANGKSTFIEVVRRLLGEHALVADFSTFLKRDSEAVRNDLARMAGARFVSAVEAEEGRVLAEALIKQVTGTDTITARFLFKEYFDFVPQFKVWLATNHKPVVRGADHGIWRRLKLIPFAVTIPPAERDKRLGERLAAELPGILAWAVRGCLAWQRDGLGSPPEIEQATAAYREEMDVFGAFLSDRCAMGPDACVESGALRAVYGRWAQDNGEQEITAKRLANTLRERGFEPEKGTRGKREWKGLRLLSDVELAEASGGRRIGGTSGGDSPLIAQAPDARSIEDAISPTCPADPPPSATRHSDEDWDEGDL